MKIEMISAAAQELTTSFSQVDVLIFGPQVLARAFSQA